MILLRRYRPGDLEALLRVEEESFPPGQRYSGLVFEYLLSLPGSVILLAEEGGEVIGYAAGYMEGRGVGHVASLAVRPAFRGRGVGKELMKALEAELMTRGARRLRLEVRESNMVARRLYEGLGYRVVARLPKYYGDEDGLLMVKEL